MRAGRPTSRSASALAAAVVVLGSSAFRTPLAAAEPAEGTPAPVAAWETVQRDLAGQRERLDRVVREQQGVLDALDALDAESERLEKRLRAAEREARDAEARRADADRRTAGIERENAGTKRVLAARVAALHREGRSGPLRYLAGSRSVGELVTRARAHRRAEEPDAALLSRARAEHETLFRARRDAAARAREGATALAALEERRAEIEIEREVRRDLLASLRTDGDRERRALAELEGAARALEETLSKLGALPPRAPGPTPGVAFAELRGRLRAPVSAPVARRFGRVVDAEFRTATFRKGIDFAAPVGSTVRAVAPGEVRFAGRFRGYGNMMILDHGAGWFTVYAHLAETRATAGARVGADEPIATVGDTGSLGGPLLYFEIRRGNEAVDPSRWLAGGTGLE